MSESPEPSTYKPVAGYPALANMMAINTETAIFRKFRDLQMQNLLFMEAKLIDLQLRLRDAQKEDDVVDNPRTLFARDFYEMGANDLGEVQMALHREIHTILAEYRTTLLQMMELNNAPRPTKREIEFLRGYLPHIHDDFPRGTEGSTWDAVNDGDFITLDPREQREDIVTRFLSGFMVDVYHYCVIRRDDLLCRLRKKPSRAGAPFRVYSNKGIRTVSKVITTTTSAMLPPLAIIILRAVQSPNARMLFIFGFTVVFAAALAALTKASPAEIFAATAAFTAVEVVFVGSVGPSPSP
ncbi:hypothetical protein ASPVEDRAFT_88005 [Aspergillus versicolor CBS 583.65]|uniref:DUF6594 domain-containing protein n=1 Tax=Aspergillus versicolor CBS 583.65 TaxID=1036611 RepID=A0A1L9PZ50_ASPVE|nr:uncharacterized protein ASPVEDRAFT_88005 [Aspergillus versicolor CBS 583.65]OJJ06716.1 hypothetical protein ASPVEDRAFT_88005 [Aspergillus versicolor CBS 583.65]